MGGFRNTEHMSPVVDTVCYNFWILHGIVIKYTFFRYTDDTNALCNRLGSSDAHEKRKRPKIEWASNESGSHIASP